MGELCLAMIRPIGLSDVTWSWDKLESKEISVELNVGTMVMSERGLQWVKLRIIGSVVPFWYTLKLVNCAVMIHFSLLTSTSSTGGWAYLVLKCVK